MTDETTTLPEALGPDHRHVSPGAPSPGSRREFDRRLETRYARGAARLKTLRARVVEPGNGIDGDRVRRCLSSALDLQDRLRWQLDQRRALRPGQARAQPDNALRMLADFQAAVSALEQAVTAAPDPASNIRTLTSFDDG